nr:hypothetical protein [Providencia rettgeri]
MGNKKNNHSSNAIFYIIGQENVSTNIDLYFSDIKNVIHHIKEHIPDSIIYYAPHPFYKKRNHDFFAAPIYDQLIDSNLISEIFIMENNIKNIVSIFSSVSLHLSQNKDINIYYFNTSKYYDNNALEIMKSIGAIDIYNLKALSKH